MGDVIRWTHAEREYGCSMLSDGGGVRELLADEPGRWVLAVDYASLRERFVEIEREMESMGEDLAQWKARALAAEERLEGVRAEHKDDLRELRAEPEADDE